VEGLLLDQISLVRDPRLLDLNDFVFQLLGLLEDVVFLGLKWSRVLVNALILQDSPLSVELIDLELLLVNSVVSLFDVLLKLLHFNLLLLQFSNEVFKLFLEQVILLDAVEVIDSDS
jgi:hypothetical protein